MVEKACTVMLRTAASVSNNALNTGPGITATLVAVPASTHAGYSKSLKMQFSARTQVSCGLIA